MHDNNKAKLKKLLLEWGSSNREIILQQSEAEKLQKACDKAVQLQKNGCGCTVISIESLKQRAASIAGAMDTRIALKGAVDEIVNGMPFDMQQVLRARYVKRLCWKDLSAHLPYAISERQCYRLHNSALNILSDALFGTGTIKTDSLYQRRA